MSATAFPIASVFLGRGNDRSVLADGGYISNKMEANPANSVLL